jgi:hypothetical protein
MRPGPPRGDSVHEHGSRVAGGDEAAVLAAEGEVEALLALPEDDDAPAPETGLHALGQLGTAVVVVACLVAAFVVMAAAVRWVFH